jgi:7-carboxy-7-deazaguanine synthase
MKIYSIFQSIDGEINLWGQGAQTVFVRTSGCNLFCKFCDTKYALSPDSGQEMSLETIIKQVKNLGPKKVTITGGEPLLQRNSLLKLMKLLWREGFKISIETNGSLPIIPLWRWNKELCWVVDYKLEFSEKMNKYAFNNLTEQDFVKIVVRGTNNIIEANKIKNYLIDDGCKADFFLSPSFNEITPEELEEEIKKLGYFDFGVNLQIHKLIYPNVKNGEER